MHNLLQSIVAKTLNSKKKLYCAFVDFEKCFDRLDRVFIWQKLLKENVSTKLINAIQAMYSVVKSVVRYKSPKSEFLDSNIGVKQGDPSSSLIFLFFINDLLSNFDTNIDGLFTANEINIFILLFCDDAILFAETPNALQSLLNDLETYCNLWDLKVNT